VVGELWCPPVPPLAPDDPQAARPTPANATKTIGTTRRRILTLRTTVAGFISPIFPIHPYRNIEFIWMTSASSTDAVTYGISSFCVSDGAEVVLALCGATPVSIGSKSAVLTNISVMVALVIRTFVMHAKLRHAPRS
jgi:hypothetical protein